MSDIYEKIKSLHVVPVIAIENLEDVMQQDEQARREANNWVKKIYG